MSENARARERARVRWKEPNYVLTLFECVDWISVSAWTTDYVWHKIYIEQKPLDC